MYKHMGLTRDILTVGVVVLDQKYFQSILDPMVTIYLIFVFKEGMMAQWYVKDLSKITGVSVQTLHHYDRIDLLNPSLRMPNGYRVYSEQDLLRLQQILALKYFGFELEHIKTLLKGTVNVHDHFTVQAKFLREKAKSLQEASDALQNILHRCEPDKSIPWETIIQLIEVFNMSHELEKSWAGEVFSPEELKQYARFEIEKQARYTDEDKQKFTDMWISLVAEVRANLNKDPRTDIGSMIAQKMMSHVNALYGKEHANLRHSIWEKGFKKGKMDGIRDLDSAVVAWLDAATDHYYRERIYALLAKVELGDTPELADQWQSLMTEMFGNAEDLKRACYEEGQHDSRVGPKARQWLKRLN